MSHATKARITKWKILAPAKKAIRSKWCKFNCSKTFLDLKKILNLVISMFKQYLHLWCLKFHKNWCNTLCFLGFYASMPTPLTGKFVKVVTFGESILYLTVHNSNRDVYLDVYIIFHRVKLTVWTICAFRVMNPRQDNNKIFLKMFKPNLLSNNY